jgi:hypothetical protein
MKLKQNFLIVQQSLQELEKEQAKKNQNKLEIQESKEDPLDSIKNISHLEASIENEENNDSSTLSEFKDNLSIENTCSVESDYKDTGSVKSNYIVHSFEDCHIFLVKLMGILKLLSKNNLGQAFEEIFMESNCKEKPNKVRSTSGKRIIIKKRTLRATELQKINLKNKSFSG